MTDQLNTTRPNHAPLAITAAAAMVAGLSACGGGQTPPADPSDAASDLGDDMGTEMPGHDAAGDHMSDAAAGDKDCCKGKNDCKGQGACAVEGSHDCGGKNDCKGQGGCKPADC